MKRILPLGVFAVALILLPRVVSAMAPSPARPESVRLTASFDSDWHFLKADAPGAENPGFDDRSWRVLNVPHVTATVVDANGVPVPNAGDLITFNLDGPGVVAAVDSDDNASREPFQASSRHAYEGVCFAFVKAGAAKGRITLTASAPGLNSSSVTIDTSAAK
jgi:hypothetical protein